MNIFSYIGLFVLPSILFSSFFFLFFFFLFSFFIFSFSFSSYLILTSIQCLNIPHPPCTCEMMTKWAQKCKDDSETSNWLNSNTKTCPKCGKVIEKDGMKDKNKKKGEKQKKEEKEKGYSKVYVLIEDVQEGVTW